jgi:hypothetical protein
MHASPEALLDAAFCEASSSPLTLGFFSAPRAQDSAIPRAMATIANPPFLDVI